MRVNLMRSKFTVAFSFASFFLVVALGWSQGAYKAVVGKAPSASQIPQSIQSTLEAQGVHLRMLRELLSVKSGGEKGFQRKRAPRPPRMFSTAASVWVNSLESFTFRAPVKTTEVRPSSPVTI